MPPGLPANGSARSRRSSAILSAVRSPPMRSPVRSKDIPPLAAERLVLIAAPSSMPAIFKDFGRFAQSRPALAGGHGRPGRTHRRPAAARIHRHRCSLPARRCRRWSFMRRTTAKCRPTMQGSMPAPATMSGCTGPTGSAIAASSLTGAWSSVRSASLPNTGSRYRCIDLNILVFVPAQPGIQPS